MSDYDETDDIELDQNCAKEAAQVLRDHAGHTRDDGRAARLIAVANALDTFATGGFKIIQED